MITKIEENISEAKEGFEELNNLTELERLEKQREFKKDLIEIITYLQKEILRKMVLEEDIRVDGRDRDEVRELSAEVGLFERTHGSRIISKR